MQPRQMVRPRIKEISGVDHPAHLTEGWLLMKDASPETAAILADAEAIAKGIAPDAPEEETSMDHDEEFEKALEGMAPIVKDRFRDQQAQLSALNDERESTHFQDMAKALVHLPKVTVSEFGPVLRKAASTVDEDTFDAIFDVLKAADSAIAQSGLYREIGTGHGGSTDNALGTIEAVAKSLRTVDPSLTEADSIVKAAEMNPDLYAQHRQEA